MLGAQNRCSGPENGTFLGPKTDMWLCFFFFSQGPKTGIYGSLYTPVPRGPGLQDRGEGRGVGRLLHRAGEVVDDEGREEEGDFRLLELRLPLRDLLHDGRGVEEE